MNTERSLFGSKSATGCGTAEKRTAVPSTATELLAEIKRRGLPHDQMAMLRSTVVHICDCLGKILENLTVKDVLTCRPLLKKHLQDRHYSRNSVRSYCNFVRMLSAQATVLGCTIRPPELTASWEPVWRQLLFPVNDNH